MLFFFTKQKTAYEIPACLVGSEKGIRDRMKVAVDWFEKHKKDETNMVIVSTANPYKFPQDVLYAVTGNDVKDSFKGVKRLHAATAMAVPKCLKELKDKPARFTKTCDGKKLFDEVLEFIK